MIFVYLKGDNQLRWGDRRGFGTEREAAFAAKWTTYACVYKACAYEKRTTEQGLILAWKDLLESGKEKCQAFRADDPMWNFTHTAIVGFKRCNALSNGVTCSECMYGYDSLPWKNPRS